MRFLIAIALLFLAAQVHAGGPKYTYKTPRGLDDEMQNIYHDIKNPIINYGTASSFTVTSISVSTMTVSSFTATGANLSALNMLNNKITNLANGTNPTDAVAFGQLPSGSTKVLQTANATSSAATATTSTSYADTSLTITIVPTSASSLIVIWVKTYAFINSGGATLTYGLSRAGSDLVANGIALATNSAAARCQVPVAFVYVDNPATTSSTKYVLRIKSSGAGVDVRDNVDGLVTSMYMQEVQ